jgi:MoaA/NifB/PqqE/SkfB family radical SAM enzyme
LRLAALLDGARIAARAIADTAHPILAQIVPMRRCNLACTYCNEYDKVSDPVPLATVRAWIAKLAELRTEIVTLSGGEPMLHPDVDALIAAIRSNGSIDNVRPDAVSQKSLALLDRKLANLAEHARFSVNVNTVLGSGCAHPEDALAIARRARELGFSTSIGVIHDGSGRLAALDAREREVYDEVARIGRGAYTRINAFQQRLIAGQPNDWRCRAGARYLYVCEQGLVHYCSQQRGHPGIPLADYTEADIIREFTTPKACAPFCTIGCVHRASALDSWRG